MSRRIPASDRTREALSALIEGRLSSEAGRVCGGGGEFLPGLAVLSPLSALSVVYVRHLPVSCAGQWGGAAVRCQL